MPTCSFGGIGVFAIPEMGRFYRHVLVEKRYPHHGAVAFGHHGKALFELFKLLGIQDIGFNQPKGMLYKTRTPSPKKENAIQKGGTPGGMPLFLLPLGLLPPQTESGLAKAKPLFLTRFRLDLLRPQGHHRVFLGGAAGGDDAREQSQGGADEHQHQGPWAGAGRRLRSGCR